jgi:hypothetical protein
MSDLTGKLRLVVWRDESLDLLKELHQLLDLI